MNGRKVILQVSWSRRSKANPTESDLDNAIDRLSGEEYMILSRDQMEYMQAIPGSVEYRTDGRHYRCEFDLSDKNSIRRAMSAYLDRNDFRTGFAWYEISDELNRQNRNSRMIAIVAGALGIALIVWMVMRS